jgi:hypothetical protein
MVCSLPGALHHQRSNLSFQELKGGNFSTFLAREAVTSCSGFLLIWKWSFCQKTLEKSDWRKYNYNITYRDFIDP